MDNFGWSIALVPGTPLIIGDNIKTKMGRNSKYNSIL